MSGILDLLLTIVHLLLRPAVLLQLLVVLLPLLLSRLLRRRGPAQRRWQVPFPLHGLLLTLPALLVLALLSQPIGLALLCLLLIAGWWLMRPLERLLGLCLPGRQRRRLFGSVVRPAYLLICIAVLLDQFVTLSAVAALPLGRLFGAEIDIGALALVALEVYVLLIVAGPLGQLLARGLQLALACDDGSRKAIALIGRYLLLAAGVVILASQLGLNQNALLAIAGGVSIGVGFGIREIVANVVSGLWLLFEGSVRPGEVLYLDGLPCEVRSLGLRATTLWRDRDNAELLIPNQTFFTAPATLYSAIQTGTDRLRRSEVLVMAAYRHRPAAVTALLVETALRTPRVLQAPPPLAYVLDYAESGVSYALRFFIANPLDHSAITSAVRMAIWEAFAADGIEIPYPQRVWHDAQPPAENR